MSLSLREEIEKQLKIGITLPYTIESFESQTDTILNIFKKRIDKLREEQISNITPTEECAGILKGLRMARELLK